MISDHVAKSDKAIKAQPLIPILSIHKFKHVLKHVKSQEVKQE